MTRADDVRRVGRAKTDYVRRYKADRGCAVCGERDPVVLQLDHIDPDTKVKNNVRSTSWRRFSWDDLEVELQKCQVLCANDHARKTAAERGGWSRDATTP